MFSVCYGLSGDNRCKLAEATLHLCFYCTSSLLNKDNNNNPLTSLMLFGGKALVSGRWLHGSIWSLARRTTNKWLSHYLFFQASFPCIYFFSDTKKAESKIHILVSEDSEFLSSLVLKTDKVNIVGDFNIHVDVENDCLNAAFISHTHTHLHTHTMQCSLNNTSNFLCFFKFSILKNRPYIYETMSLFFVHPKLNIKMKQAR